MSHKVQRNTGILVLLGLMLIGWTSFVHIPCRPGGASQASIYFADDLPPVHIVALRGQKRPQAQILGPGFHPKPFIKLLYDVGLEGAVAIPGGVLGAPPKSAQQ
jgi:hypothetical protein